jgi:hypothetical protein
MPDGFTLITATKIQDASGRALASGTVTFFPVSSPGGGPVSAIAKDGGTITQTGVPFLVVNGAITTDMYGGAPQLADTTETTPANIAYRVTIVDSSTGREIEGPGYGLVQPSGPSFSLDTYIPIQPCQVTVQAGPPGAAGVAGTLIAEVPGGVIGTDTTFTLAHTPASVIGVFRNGLLRAASEYTFNSATTFSWTTNPITEGESHAVLYIHA